MRITQTNVYFHLQDPEELMKDCFQEMLHIKIIRKSFKTRYVDSMLTFEFTPVTIGYIHPPHHGHTRQYHDHGWMTRILFIPCQTPSHSSDKVISDPDLEIPRSRSWVWSKGKVIQLGQYPNRLLFISHQSDQQSLRYSYFEI